jgi:hypothetical protein
MKTKLTERYRKQEEFEKQCVPASIMHNKIPKTDQDHNRYGYDKPYKDKIEQGYVPLLVMHNELQQTNTNDHSSVLVSKKERLMAVCVPLSSTRPTPQKLIKHAIAPRRTISIVSCFLCQENFGTRFTTWPSRTVF